MKITPSPLCWPVGWKRTSNPTRGPFGSGGSISIEAAVKRLRLELGRMNVDEQDIIVSTNLVLRLDGFPRSGQPQPRDRGTAVYWMDPWKKQPRAMAIDRYDKVEQNIAALAATIEAMRAIERHGGAKVIERAFAGFVALPPPAGRPWHEVLEISPLCSLAEARQAFMRLRSKYHPDKNGGAESSRYQEVMKAWDECALELGEPF